VERDLEDLERRARTELAIRSRARSRGSLSSLLSPSFCLDRSSLNFPRPLLVEPVVVFTAVYLIIKSVIPSASAKPYRAPAGSARVMRRTHRMANGLN
jgi:hypothetical protein